MYAANCCWLSRRRSLSSRAHVSARCLVAIRFLGRFRQPVKCADLGACEPLAAAPAGIVLLGAARITGQGCTVEIEASTRCGVMGNCSGRAPTASKIAFAITAPMLITGGSPHPETGASGLSISTISIFGSQE